MNFIVFIRHIHYFFFVNLISQHEELHLFSKLCPSYNYKVQFIHVFFFF